VNLEISHTTRYEYDQVVQFHPHILYLRPRENPLLRVSRFAFTLKPDATIYWMRDDFDNLPASAHFLLHSDVLEIGVNCVVETSEKPTFDFLVRDYATEFPFKYEPLHQFNLAIYLTPPEPEICVALKKWLEPRFQYQPTNTIAWILELNQVLNRSLTYQRRDEQGIQSALETIRRNAGSCRDYASLFVAIARTLGVAARFVSGYLYDPLLHQAAGGDMHAWVEIFLPGAGWRGLDPTNGIFCNSYYVPVAHAVIAESINPIQGSFQGQGQATSILTSHVSIRHLDPVS
jgi:transglutaminase-like putative cysteine protease